MSNMRNCDSCNEKHYCKSYGVLSYCDKCVNSAVANLGWENNRDLSRRNEQVKRSLLR